MQEAAARQSSGEEGKAKKNETQPGPMACATAASCARHHASGEVQRGNDMMHNDSAGYKTGAETASNTMTTGSGAGGDYVPTRT